jgi:hypothetical protein
MADPCAASIIQSGRRHRIPSAREIPSPRPSPHLMGRGRTIYASGCCLGPLCCLSCGQARVRSAGRVTPERNSPLTPASPHLMGRGRTIYASGCCLGHYVAFPADRPECGRRDALHRSATAPSPRPLSPSDGARENRSTVPRLPRAFCRLSCGLLSKPTPSKCSLRARGRLRPYPRAHFREVNSVRDSTARAAVRSALALAVSDMACAVARRTLLSSRSAVSRSTSDAPPVS